MRKKKVTHLLYVLRCGSVGPPCCDVNMADCLFNGKWCLKQRTYLKAAGYTVRLADPGYNTYIADRFNKTSWIKNEKKEEVGFPHLTQTITI